MPTTIRLVLPDVRAVMEAQGVAPGGRAQKLLASEVLRCAAPYVPMDTGTLQRQVDMAQDGTYIQYNAPYARYLYFGKVMVGVAPKRVTDKALHYYGAPKRGARWIERMWSEHGPEILAAVAKAAGGRPR